MDTFCNSRPQAIESCPEMNRDCLDFIYLLLGHVQTEESKDKLHVLKIKINVGSQVRDNEKNKG